MTIQQESVQQEPTAGSPFVKNGIGSIILCCLSRLIDHMKFPLAITLPVIRLWFLHSGFDLQIIQVMKP